MVTETMKVAVLHAVCDVRPVSDDAAGQAIRKVGRAGRVVLVGMGGDEIPQEGSVG